MAAAWTKLGDEYASDSRVNIASADCENMGREACASAIVQGFPTLMYYSGQPGAQGEEYNGERDYISLKAWVQSEFAAGPAPVPAPTPGGPCNDDGPPGMCPMLVEEGCCYLDNDPRWNPRCNPDAVREMCPKSCDLCGEGGGGDNYNECPDNFNYYMCKELKEEGCCNLPGDPGFNGACNVQAVREGCRNTCGLCDTALSMTSYYSNLNNGSTRNTALVVLFLGVVSGVSVAWIAFSQQQRSEECSDAYIKVDA